MTQVETSNLSPRLRKQVERELFYSSLEKARETTIAEVSLILEAMILETNPRESLVLSAPLGGVALRARKVRKLHRTLRHSHCTPIR